ncbi:MAG TPA: acyl carrier protein [Thiotrichales bacterium]|nr:acyl carrier protein [Thiotrichales bacterium]
MLAEQHQKSRIAIHDLIVETVIRLAEDQEIDRNRLHVEMSLDSLANLGFDSLAVFQLICEVEHSLGIEIDNESADSIRTLGDLVEICHRLCSPATS